MHEAEIKSFDTVSDNEVITRILAGEKSMYELIMRRYNRCLFRIGLSILKNKTDVEDAMQETYVKAYQHLHNFQYRSSLLSWLVRILINESLLKQKRQSRFKSIDGSVIVFDTDLTIENETPEQSLLNRELKNVLEQAILELPADYSQVYIMREVEQMSVKETSDCLGISEANVKVRLNRAKVMIREFLSTVFSEADIFAFHLIRCNRIVAHVMARI